MTFFTIVIVMWLTACAISLLGIIIMFMCKRPDMNYFEERVNTFTILFTPEKYIKAPYARVVQILTVISLTLFIVTIVVYAVWRNFFPCV